MNNFHFLTLAFAFLFKPRSVNKCLEEILEISEILVLANMQILYLKKLRKIFSCLHKIPSMWYQTLVIFIFIVKKYVYAFKISHILEKFDLYEGQTFTFIFLGCGRIYRMSLIFLRRKPCSSKHLVPKKCFIFVFCWNSFSSFAYTYIICLLHIASVLECF